MDIKTNTMNYESGSSMNNSVPTNLISYMKEISSSKDTVCQNSHKNTQTILKVLCLLKIICVLSHVQLCDPMACSLPDPQPMEFSRQEYWSGLPFPSLGDLPNQGIKLRSPKLQEDFLLLVPPGK